MKIYTKTGDKGLTSLADGQRVSKTDLRIEAYGTADELNSFVGLLRAKISPNESEENASSVASRLEWIQNKLFNLGAYLAGADGDWIFVADVEQLEHWMDELQAELEPQHAFVLPGGNEQIALCHVCRTVTRRLERAILRLSDVAPQVVQFVNRLSDFWFLMARMETKNAKIAPFYWKN